MEGFWILLIKTIIISIRVLDKSKVYWNSYHLIALGLNILSYDQIKLLSIMFVD